MSPAVASGTVRDPGLVPRPVAGPVVTAPAEGPRPPSRSPVLFVLGWFLIPLIAVLLLDHFGVFAKVSAWLASL